MKGIITSLCLVAALGLVSCDENARLAKNLQGTWSGTPENFSDNSVVTATILETFNFSDAPAAVAQGSKGGEVVIAGMISASTQILATGDMAEPLTLTASAKSTVSGTWTVIDDDEVALTLDPASLSVEVDPQTVVVEGNLLSGATPQMDSIRPSVASSVATSMKRALTARYASFRHLDDVKVKEPLLKFEIGTIDYVFTRQGGAQ